jgi:RHS repeat-associated protein
MRHLTMSTWARRGRPWLGSGLLAAMAVALAPTPAAAQAEVVEYYATDAVGSVRVVFDPNGNVKARSDYLPFGEAVGTTGSLPAQRFTGQERDGEVGRDNFNARGFALRIGRFGSVDPVGGTAKQPQTWNRYAYVRNNPLGRVDPSGGYDGPVATPTTNCRQDQGAYWCPGSLFIPNPYDPSSVDPLFNPDRQGYRGGEEMNMAEMQYGAGVAEQFQRSVAAAQAQSVAAPRDEAKVETQEFLGALEPQILPPGARTPITGTPNSWSWYRIGSGSNVQDIFRYFGPDGKAVPELHVGQDHGFGEVHGHWWRYTVNGVQRAAMTLSEWIASMSNFTLIIMVDPCAQQPIACGYGLPGEI